MITRTRWNKIWSDVCDAFNTPWEERTEAQQDMTYNGLCCAVTEQTNGEINGFKLVPYVAGRDPNEYWWPTRSDDGYPSCEGYFQHDEDRAAYALSMVNLTDEEFDKLVAGFESALCPKQDEEEDAIT